MGLTRSHPHYRLMTAHCRHFTKAGMPGGVTEGTPTAAFDPWRGGCVLAVGLGFITVVAFYGMLSLDLGPLRGLPSDEWPILLLHAMIAGAPFGVLALRGVRAKLPWLVALVLTVCFWGALFYSVWLSARDQTGANIGMGWLMLASPFFITGGALIAAELTRARS